MEWSSLMSIGLCLRQQATIDEHTYCEVFGRGEQWTGNFVQQKSLTLSDGRVVQATYTVELPKETSPSAARATAEQIAALVGP